jgi:hypothetical protein
VVNKRAEDRAVLAGIRTKSAGKTSSGKTPARKPSPRQGRLTQAQVRAGFLIDAFGSASALADILGVSRSQPGKWRDGEEVPGPEASALIIDVDHVLARATLVWEPGVARRWLVGTEPFLGGARPIDVLRQRGSRDVVEALDAVVAGSFA